jgi:NAD(P)-dependent dehydrogenase (short-subunit alcohol dehydrogenase family)
MAEAQMLAGKVALVTGAGKNIGKAIALRLAQDGAAVVVNGRGDRAIIGETVQEIRAAGGRALPYLADVSKADAVAGMVEAAVTEFGGLDIAINNAGLRRQTPFLQMNLDEWHEILSVALDGAFTLAKAAVPEMIKRGGGALVGLSGVSHHAGSVGGRSRRLYARARDGAGAAQHHRELRGAGLNRHGARPLGWRRAWPREHLTRDSGRAAGPAGGDRRDGALPGRPRGALRHRPDDPRQRRPVPRKVTRRVIPAHGPARRAARG